MIQDRKGLAMDSQEETQHLVSAAKSGDRAAFEELFRRYRSRLEPFVESRLKEPLREKVDVGDVLQETLLRAFQSLGRFEWEGGDSFLRWLGGIARNVMLQIASAERRRKTIVLDHEPLDDGASPSTLERREERLERFQASIDELSPDHRKVIFLARVQRVPIREIARRMNRSPDAVSQLLMRAVKKLKDSFGETESFHLPDRLYWGEEVTAGEPPSE